MNRDRKDSMVALSTHTARPLSLTCKAFALLLLLGALLAGFAPMPAWAQVGPVCTPPPSGMVSWWGGDGNAFDIVGTNHGTLVNGATFAPGMVGQAFSFDGVDDSVNVGDLDLPSTFTIDAWIKPAAMTHLGWILVKDGPGAVQRSYYFSLDNAGTLALYVRNESGQG